MRPRMHSMYIYPYSASYNTELFADPETETLFSDKQMLQHFLQIEIALTKALALSGIISEVSASRICECIAGFEPDHQKLTSSAYTDGLIIPELIRQLRNTIESEYSNDLHLGSTSQDLIDTALTLSLSAHSEILGNRLKYLVTNLSELNTKYGKNNLRAYTRMQYALDIKATTRIGSWLHPLARKLDELPHIRNSISIIQMGGPVGNRSGFGENSQIITEFIANYLDLREPGTAWHSERDRLVGYANFCTTLTSALGKLGQDVLLMAQMGEIAMVGGGSSSVMKHKSNPVRAELLVTLARYTAVLQNGMQHAQIHEQERSGSMWTLEWIVLPQICVLVNKSLLIAQTVIEAIEAFGSQDLTRV